MEQHQLAVHKMAFVEQAEGGRGSAKLNLPHNPFSSSRRTSLWKTNQHTLLSLRRNSAALVLEQRKREQCEVSVAQRGTDHMLLPLTLPLVRLCIVGASDSSARFASREDAVAFVAVKTQHHKLCCPFDAHPVMREMFLSFYALMDFSQCRGRLFRLLSHICGPVDV